jgi:predicted nuclease with TOPRIM domain
LQNIQTQIQQLESDKVKLEEQLKKKDQVIEQISKKLETLSIEKAENMGKQMMAD